jgi:hypothetical protein
MKCVDEKQKAISLENPHTYQQQKVQQRNGEAMAGDWRRQCKRKAHKEITENENPPAVSIPRERTRQTEATNRITHNPIPSGKGPSSPLLSMPSPFCHTSSSVVSGRFCIFLF